MWIKNIDMLQLMMNAHTDAEHEDKGTGKRQPLSTDDVTAQVIYIIRFSLEIVA